MELRVTGILVGKLIEHQVLPPNFLQTALHSVLESLREPVNSTFFFFGACALQHLAPRLREYWFAAADEDSTLLWWARQDPGQAPQHCQLKCRNWDVGT
jgi:hypothetical protein